MLWLWIAEEKLKPYREDMYEFERRHGSRGLGKVTAEASFHVVGMRDWQDNV